MDRDDVRMITGGGLQVFHLDIHVMVDQRAAYLLVEFLQVGCRNVFILVQLFKARAILGVDGIPIGRVYLPDHIVFVDSVPDDVILFCQRILTFEHAGLYHIIRLIAAGGQQGQQGGQYPYIYFNFTVLTSSAYANILFILI